MNSNTVTHLEMKMPDGNNRHYYYGSLSAIFSTWNPADVGVNLRALYQHKLSPAHPYENDKCIIRQGTVVRKTQRPHAKFNPFD